MLTSWLYYNGKNLQNKDLAKVLEEARANKVESLDLSKNSFSNISFSGEPLPDLKVLDISYNQAEMANFVLPAALFPNLAYLFLHESKIKNFEIRGSLPRLHTIDLSKNQLVKFELSLENFLALETLYLYKNPIEDTVIRGFLKDGESCLTDIRNYFLELEKGEIINEKAKLIIVGNGRVGKTSLFKKLQGLGFDKNEIYTHGIQIGKLEKTHLPEAKTENLNLNVWDFGGQEIFYATHQFFLSDDAVYILAWTKEKM
ncbi:MAG: hypothetical protein EAZ08_04815 [Cytophagales bacterium]|nr:MAG: hypothetical protein EAZ08_04815 [Cytophagales bacterium]